MLGVYLNTLIIGHKCCNVLSKLNELTLQKALQRFMTNNVFWTKKTKKELQNKIQTHIKGRASAGN